MADSIGLDQGQLSRIESATRELARANSRETIRAAGQVAEQLEKAISVALERVDEIATFAGFDPEETRTLRRGIETVDGAVDGLKGALPFALAQRGPGGVVLAAGGALVGALAGNSREAVRRAAEAASLRDQDFFDSAQYKTTLQQIEALDKQYAERRASVRRSGRVR